MKITTLTVVLVVAFLLVARFSLAWGHEGHRVVAKIAARNLSQDARKKVAAILGVNDAGLEEAMASAATWPDEINKQQTGTANWHFIDVPVTAPFSVTGLCVNHACVIDQIVNMQDRLQNNRTGFTLLTAPNPSRPMTSQELAFLIHFVGDIHQPLHAATDGDRGGNCVKLTHALTNGSGSPRTELHAAWDVDEVLAVFKALGDEDATATALFQRFKSGAQVPQLTPDDWARESNDLAKKDVYQQLHLPNHTAPPNQCAANIAQIDLTQAYLDGNTADAERQLMRAGIRLSNLLNSICGGTGCQANPVALAPSSKRIEEHPVEPADGPRSSTNCSSFARAASSEDASTHTGSCFMRRIPASRQGDSSRRRLTWRSTHRC